MRSMVYNEELSKEERTMYTGRLLKLHEIIADSPPEQYDHRIYTQRNGFWKRLRTRCGTAACAIGHAFLHHEQFPGLAVQDFRQVAPTLVRDGKIPPVQPANTSVLSYFGPESWNYIFRLEAYDKDDEEVTKYDALQRIEDYIEKVLGCKLIQIPV